MTSTVFLYTEPLVPPTLGNSPLVTQANLAVKFYPKGESFRDENDRVVQQALPMPFLARPYVDWAALNSDAKKKMYVAPIFHQNEMNACDSALFINQRFMNNALSQGPVAAGILLAGMFISVKKAVVCWGASSPSELDSSPMLQRSVKRSAEALEDGNTDPYLGIPREFYDILAKPGGRNSEAAENPKYNRFLCERFGISQEEVEDSRDWILLNLTGTIYVTEREKTQRRPDQFIQCEGEGGSGGTFGGPV
ncbi:hypothetical protein DFS34DRAFT_654076 [Phlyctochytrium arcticum]|nr:hypothetical protein DFS34DRAFT_654076 [Phlyctochytrium arcticum]